MISFKKWHEIHHLTEITFFHIVHWLWQQLADQDALLENDIAHQLSPAEASWQVTIQDVTVKCDGFLTLESPIIWWIYSFCHRRQRAMCHLICVTGRGELVVWRFGGCLTGQNRTKTGQDRVGRQDGSDTLVDFTGVSVMPISPISQQTFIWHNFLALTVILQIF